VVVYIAKQTVIRLRSVLRVLSTQIYFFQ